MNVNRLFILVSTITLVLLMAGVSGAFSPRLPPSLRAVTAPVSSGISYQGRLTSPDGAPLDGPYTMRFVVYDDEVAGAALWDSGDVIVTVEGGLFTVPLGVDQANFDGQALWLSIIVEEETLSPRQEILPAPYALSLRPGADIVGDSIDAADAILAGYAPATGTAFHADANGGVGLLGDSQNNYGVWGASVDSWGGYFTSESGYGVRVDSRGAAHFDHGAYVTSDGGYGVYAQSAQNQAVRGEGGDVTGIVQPLGAVGVVGIGTNRGTYGASGSGSGLYGISDGNYGLWAQSSAWRGATGRTDRADNNYGFYTPDNLFAANVNLAGAVMQVMENGGEEPLAPGDVVVFSGINRLVAAVDSPIIQVRKASTANSAAVAGVVFSRFNIDAIDPELESPDHAVQEAAAAMAVTPAGSAPAGGYVLVVVHGLAQVNVSAVTSDSIRPGDLLSTSRAAGSAKKAATITTNGMDTAIPGTVFAKALEPFDGTQDVIYVYVTLQ